MMPQDFQGIQTDVKVECPKCGSHTARFEPSNRDVFLRCLCGLNKLVASTIETAVIEHVDSGEDVSLPRKHTKLWDCLMMLHGLAPASTQEITDMLNYRPGALRLSVSDVASQLTVLKYKGLVRAVNSRRGYAGGSTWVCTEAALKIMGG